MKQPGEFSLPPVIILAGGRSERYGSPKGLAPFGSETLLFSHMCGYAQSGSRVMVVLGYYTDPYIDEIERVKSRLQECKYLFNYVVNERFDLGPFSSIQTGLTALRTELENGVFIQPVDTGVVTADVFNRLYSESFKGTFSVIPECQGQRGHPVFVSAALADRLLLIEPTSSIARLDYQLKAEPHESVRRISVDCQMVLENRNTGSG